MALAATVERYRELGFRVIEGGRSGKLVVLNTRVVAEIYSKDHKNVLASVREQQEILGLKFSQGFAEHCIPATYKAADGKDQPCFNLTKIGLVTVALKWDAILRFLLALTFDALERDDAEGANAAVAQINQHVRELRSRASGQDELLLETPQSVVAPLVPTDDDDDDLDDTKARHIWHREAPFNDNAPAVPKALALDRWVDAGWHIRRRYDAAGNPLMVWMTSDDAISTEKKWMIPSPNGRSQVLFCFNNPFPPIEIVLRTYDTLGPGPYAPVAKATLRHYLT